MGFKALALAIAMASLLILSTFLYVAPEKISSEEHLLTAKNNQKVLFSGKVTEERQFGSSKILILNNSLEIICRCPFPLKNKNISGIGVVSDFQKKRIEILRLKIN